jgi:hypothetical protein
MHRVIDEVEDMEEKKMTMSWLLTPAHGEKLAVASVGA